MILVDTAVWIDHLRAGDASLDMLLQRGRILSHPFIVGEIGMGSFKQRDEILYKLRRLPQATIAEDHEVLKMVRDHSLFGRGIGYIDAHLLTAAVLTPEALLWTRDRRLSEIAISLGVGFQEIH